MKVSTSMVVGAPPAAVFALLSDPGALTRVTHPQVEIVDDRVAPDGTRHVSTRSRLSAGATVERTTVVTEAVPNERVVVRSALRTTRGETARNSADSERATTLSPDPGGTLVETRTELRVRPAWRGILLALFYRHRIQAEFEATMAAVQDHFRAPEDEVVEHELTYTWTESDERAARVLLWMSSGYNQFWAALAVLAIVLFALGAIGLILALSVAGALPALAVPALVPWNRLTAEKQVRVQIGTHGLRIEDEGERGNRLLPWSDVSGIARRGRFFLLRGRRKSIGRYLPRRAFADAPAALAALREHSGAVA